MSPFGRRDLVRQLSTVAVKDDAVAIPRRVLAVVVRENVGAIR